MTFICGGAFDQCKGATGIVIPDSVTSIGDSAFRDCVRLTNIVIPESVTSIGRRAFEGCRSLSSIVIPESVTSIGEDAFEGCSSLTQFTTGIKLTPKMLGNTIMKCAADMTLNPLTVNNLTRLPVPLKPFAAVGFAENPDDPKSARGKSHITYIKKSAAELMEFALKYISLLRLMVNNQLLMPEVAKTYLDSAQVAGNAEAVAMLMDYQNNKLLTK